MALLIGLVAVIAVIEAAWNLGKFVGDMLHLPWPLAVAFPGLAEAAAASFALQDLSDRRRGNAIPALRLATYLTLGASSLVNGIVGAAAHGPAGLLEMLPPLMLAIVIHLHGARATLAWHSRALLRPGWRDEQLRLARLDSVMEVLPLLTGSDSDGQATVALLRRRLESGTLTPAEALVAAGWRDRHQRVLTPSQIRRLEIVAATVWGGDVPPSVPPRTPSVGTSLARTATPSRPAPPTRPDESDGRGARSASDEQLVQFVREARAVRATAGEGSVRALLTAAGLTASAERIRSVLRALEAATEPIPDGSHPGLHLVGTGAHADSIPPMVAEGR
jgi:hypothetical protein